MTEKSKWFKLSIILILVVILSDLAFLNYKILVHPSQNFITFPQTKNILVPGSSFPTKTMVDENGEKIKTIGFDVIDSIINHATASLSLKVNNLEAQIAATDVGRVQPTPMANLLNKSVKTVTVREFYIPLGSGSTTSREWVDLPGVEAYVVPTNYGVITGLYFEVGLRNPTGNGTAYARLKNVTDNTSIFESEIFREGASAGFLSSGKVPVPTHTKLYRVQLKSSLGAEVVLDNARLKIFVQ